MSRLPMAALILDMDGVIADTEPLHVRAWDKAITQVMRETGVDGEDLLARILEERLKLTGMTGAVISREMVQRLALPVTADKLLAMKRVAYRDILDQGIAAFPGLPDELNLWTNAPLALATSAVRSEALLLLDRLGLTKLFDPIITSDDVPNAKPAPDCYRLVARMLGTRPEECVVIEDSLNGIRAGLAAGAIVLAVSPVALPGSLGGVRATFPSTLEALRWLRG